MGRDPGCRNGGGRDEWLVERVFGVVDKGGRAGPPPNPLSAAITAAFTHRAPATAPSRVNTLGIPRPKLLRPFTVLMANRKTGVAPAAAAAAGAKSWGAALTAALARIDELKKEIEELEQEAADMTEGQLEQEAADRAEGL